MPGLGLGCHREPTCAPAEHQLCLSHQIHDLTYADEADEPIGQHWTHQLRQVFGRAIRLHHRRARLTAVQFATRRTRTEWAAERLIFSPPLEGGFVPGALAKGADIAPLQEMLGHSSNFMTRHYLGQARQSLAARQMLKYAPI